MTLDGLLAPLTGATRRDGWRQWVWVLFFALAPIVFWAGLKLHGQNARRDAEQFADPPQMLAAARRIAAKEGVSLTGWKSIQQVIVSDPLRQFQKRSQVWAGLPADQRRLVPRTWIRVIFHSPSRDQWFAVWLRPDASVFAFDSSTGLLAPRRKLDEAEARRLATSRFESYCAGPHLDLGEPEVSNRPGSGEFASRRYVWRAGFAGLPDLRLTCAVELVGDRAKSVSADFVWSATLVESSPANQAFSQSRAIVLVSLILYGIYRFARRALEREIPWSRCAIIFVLLLGFGCFLFVVNPYFASGTLPANRALSSFTWLITASVMLSFSLQGMALSLTYGASEGELRETYPGKLTAWDALLTGRWLTRNVGAAVVVGAAAGAWAIFARAAAWEGLGLRRTLSEQQLIYSYGPLPWLMQMVNEPIGALYVVTCTLLLPLMFVNRQIAWTTARRFVLVLLAIYGASVTGITDVTAPAEVIALLLSALLVLTIFWYGDLLASIVATLVFATFGTFEDFAAMVPVWTEYSVYVLATGLITLAVALYLAYRGRAITDAEVRPVYAKRLLERLMMQTEVSAAREAQLRLLPAKPPELPGLRIEAFCSPAREVGGDFYDFYPLARGRLGVLVAEGGSTGLASALTIGLAKGFLLYAARRDWPAAEALRRLAPLLQQATHMAIERLGIAYVILDPASRSVHAARLGAYPRLFRIGATPGEVSIFEVVGAARLSEARLTLAPGESLLIFTDGIVKRILAKRKQSIEQWVKQVDSRVTASAEAIEAELLTVVAAKQGDLDDDLTAVVMRLDLAPVSERVEVA